MPRDSSVQSLSRVWLFATPWTATHQASLSFTNSQSLLKLMSMELVMPSNYLILCHPVLLPPSIFPTIKVFSSESVLHIGWPKYWSFSFSISTSNEYPGLISFRMDWFDLLAVQGTLKSLQHHSSKASILLSSVFFIVQLSHLYMTTGKTITLTGQNFVGKVMSLLFNMLSGLVLGGSVEMWPRKPVAESVHASQLLQLFLILCNAMDYSPPGFSVHGILQVRILYWVAVPSSRESSGSWDQTRVSYAPELAGGCFTTSTIWGECSSAEKMRLIYAYLCKCSHSGMCISNKFPRKADTVLPGTTSQHQ